MERIQIKFKFGLYYNIVEISFDFAEYFLYIFASRIWRFKDYIREEIYENSAII